MAWALLEKVLGSSAAEQLTTVSTKASQCFIEQKRANGNKIEIGDSTLVATKGLELVAPTSGLPLDKVHLKAKGGGSPMDLSTIYVIGTSSQGVNVYYEIF